VGLAREWAQEIKHGSLHLGRLAGCFWPKSNTPYKADEVVPLYNPINPTIPKQYKPKNWT
jgi:hypothetical protein